MEDLIIQDEYDVPFVEEKTIDIIGKEEGKEIKNDEADVNSKSDVIIYSGGVNIRKSGNNSVNLKNYDASLLWTNENPSNDFPNIGKLQLLDDVNNYDAIRIDYYNKNNGTSDDIVTIIIPTDLLTSETSNTNYVNNTWITGIYYSSQYQIRGYEKTYNDSTKLTMLSTNGTKIIPVNIYGLNESSSITPEPTPTPSPNPSVSGNVINNYYITVSGDSSVSYNLLNKPLNEYTPTESMFALSLLFALCMAFVILIRKVVFRWK